MRKDGIISQSRQPIRNTPHERASSREQEWEAAEMTMADDMKDDGMTGAGGSNPPPPAAPQIPEEVPDVGLHLPKPPLINNSPAEIQMRPASPPLSAFPEPKILSETIIDTAPKPTPPVQQQA